MERSAHRRIVFMLLSLIMLAGLSSVGNAQATRPGSSTATAPGGDTARIVGLPGVSDETIISPDDVLDIYVMDVAELSRQYRVSPSGTVVLPLLERPLQAAGLKAIDFADLIAKQLRDQGLVSRASVTVSIVASRLQSVAVTGAVKMPQIYPVFGHTTLLDILAQAQGLSDDASNIAVISRGKIGVEVRTALRERSETVDLIKLFQSGDPSYNPELYPGDRVIVPRAGIVYVVGAVTKPGGYAIKNASNGMSVLQAVAFAEGQKSTAKRDKTVVIRRDPEAPEGRKRLELDLKKIMEGKAEDPMLMANDILYIPDSQAAKALRRGAEAAIAAATGVAIYASSR